MASHVLEQVVNEISCVCVWSNYHYSPNMGDVCNGRKIFNGKLVKSKLNQEFSW